MKPIVTVKISIFFLLSFVLFSCSQATKQKIEASVYYQKNILPVFLPDNHPDMIISVKKVDCDTIIYKYDVIRTNSYIAYINAENDQYYLFTKDSVYMVSTDDCELMSGKVGERFYDVFYDHIIGNAIDFMEPFFYPKEKKIVFDNMKDSMINGIDYKILQKKFCNSLIFNDSTKEFDIPNYHIVRYYYNKNTGLINYICATPTKDSRRSCKVEYFLSYSFENPQRYINDIFDFSQQKYVNYSRHNDQFLPYSWTYSKEETPSELTPQVLNYPIISIKGDTTTIAQENGWLLLDFWWFGCKGCIKWIVATGHEKAKYGQRILEKNNIKIMSINAISDNREKLKSMAQKYDAEDIVYHAKALGEIFNISTMPQYYLISPDKKILLKTNELGDYSEVLKIKKEWENKK